MDENTLHKPANDDHAAVVKQEPELAVEADPFIETAPDALSGTELNQDKDRKRPVQYGGQALIEGVMMRGSSEYCMALRLPDGSIEVTKKPLSAWPQKKICKIPLVRGCVALIDSLIVGMKSLMYSADRNLGEETGQKLGIFEMIITLVLALGFGMLLFVGVPTVGAHFLQGIFAGSVLQNLLEGLFRLVIFFLYVLLISRMKDIQRVFAYHGAEHKVIFTYEEKQPLTADSAREHQRFHPRCGTSFLLIVVMVSIVVFIFLGTEPLWWRVLSRLLLMPVVAGISYELLKFSGRHMNSPWLSWLIAPGLWLQKLTTKEPDDQQLEVAIAALEGVLASGQEPE
jgi:uncharacterized protein YqhQ